MRGVHWPFVLGLFLVIILAIVGVSFVTQAAGFQLGPYLGLQPQIGQPGGYEYGGGAGGGFGRTPTPEHIVPSEGASYYHAAEIGCQMAGDIAGDFGSNGVNGQRAGCDFSAGGTGGFCFIGAGRFRPSGQPINTDPNFQKIIDAGCAWCPDPYLDDVCLTNNIRVQKIGAIGLCGHLIKAANGERVTFGNSVCYPQTPPYVVQAYLPCNKWDDPYCCIEMGCGGNDYVRTWEVDTSSSTGTINDQLASPVSQGRPSSDRDYIYGIYWDTAAKQYLVQAVAIPESFNVNINVWQDTNGVLYPHFGGSERRGRGLTCWKYGDYDRCDGLSNLLGIKYPEARMGANMTWTITANDITTNVFAGALEDLGYSVKDHPCESPEACLALPQVQHFKAERLYTDFPNPTAVDQNGDPSGKGSGYSGYGWADFVDGKIEDSYDGAIQLYCQDNEAEGIHLCSNQVFKPGTYRVIINNYEMFWGDLHSCDEGADNNCAWDVGPDRDNPDDTDKINTWNIPKQSGNPNPTGVRCDDNSDTGSRNWAVCRANRWDNAEVWKDYSIIIYKES